MGNKRVLVDDGGAILVHVALALLALTAFTTFVVDLGVFWASRSQAQSAADAAALAGAGAFITDHDITNIGSASQSAQSIAGRNKVWGAAPSVTITFPVCGVSTFPAGIFDPSIYCVRADTYRDANHGNPLPIIFGTLVGLTSQDVKATAQARVGGGNASTCLMPWAVPDLYDDVNGDGVYTSPPDMYIAPSSSSPGTGYTVPGAYGTQVQLTGGAPGPLSPGWRQATAIGGPGPSDYTNAIENCVNTEYGIGDILPPRPGNMSVPTLLGVDTVIARDPGASWDATNQKIIGSCVGAGTCPSYSQSPRIVSVPVFDTDVFYQTGQIKIVNILGFFVVGDGSSGTNSTVTGILINVPGLYDPSKGAVGVSSAFAQTIYLYR
jgi:hypothetical protein